MALDARNEISRVHTMVVMAKRRESLLHGRCYVHVGDLIDVLGFSSRIYGHGHGQTPLLMMT